MKYMALTIGLTDEMFTGIQTLLAIYKLQLMPSLTVNDASQLLSQQMFHLLIINLEYLRVFVNEKVVQKGSKKLSTISTK